MTDITILDHSDYGAALPFTKEVRKLLVQTVYSADYVASVSLSAARVESIIKYTLEINRAEEDDGRLVSGAEDDGGPVSDNINKEELQGCLIALLASTSTIDDIITQYLRADWHMSRIARVILSILRVATFEFFQLNSAAKNDGYNRIIRDYLGIAKSMGHKREVQFIQGIINKIIGSFQNLPPQEDV